MSLQLSSVCVLDATGKVIREAKVASEPEALVAFLREAGLDAVLLETHHVKAALSAMAVKTDRRDARGIAQLLRMGWYRRVHRKSVPSQEVRALLAARKQLQIKAMDLEQTLRGLLRGFGLKVGEVSRGKLPARVRELALGHAMLERWAMDVAKRWGMRRAKVALARKLATVLHRIWADGTEFVWGKEPATAAA